MGLAIAAANDTPPPGDDRAALRAAIAQREAAVRQMDALKAARGRASDMVDAAERKLEAARGAIERAQEQQAASMLEAATSGKPLKAGGAIRNARDAEREALDELEAARATLTKIAARLDYPKNGATGAPTDPVSAANALIARAADDVIRDAISLDSRIEQAGRLYAEVHAARTQLAALLHEGLVRPADREAVIAGLAPPPHLPAVRMNGETPTFYAFFDGDQTPWAGLRETLMRDPDAPIPE